MYGRWSAAEKSSGMCMHTEPTESDSPGAPSKDPSASVMMPSLSRWYPTMMPSPRSERPLARMNRRPPLRRPGMWQRAQGLNGTRPGALKLAKVEFAMVWLSVQSDMYLESNTRP